jgi:hypothetical protein
MSREKTTPAPVTEADSQSTPSLASMFRVIQEDMEDDTVIVGLPPTTAPFVRSPRPDVPVADISRLAKVIGLIGPGGSGKTVIARWIGGELLAKGKLDRTLLAALDPTNRTLADFFDAVQKPPSSDPNETATWLQGLLKFLADKRGNAVLDFGGGDVSLARTIEQMPTLADALEQDGIGFVACYVLTPRVDDLASLVTFERQGFRPKATALILNLARAETPAEFNAVRRQPAYKAALDRGAVELLMPELVQRVALRVERARVHFRQAMDGEASEGRKPADLSMIERSMVREFHERMRAEFQVIEGWMPWT